MRDHEKVLERFHKNKPDDEKSDFFPYVKNRDKWIFVVFIKTELWPI